MRESEPLQQVDRTYIRYRGRKLSYFGGCDYFRLSSHPRVIAAVKRGLHQFGLNVAASRLTSGNHTVYQELERRLAKFFGAKSALLVSSGYSTNLVVAQSLTGQFSHTLLDERAHGSLRDAAHFLDCPILEFKHRDLEDFSHTVRRCGGGARPIVLTDGMFAHDGSVAPLRAYLKLLPRDGLLVVDDAHGGGTIGPTGKGTIEVEGVSRARIVQNITLSKALGVYGGAVLCSPSLRARIVSRSRIFGGATPVPLPLAYAAGQALEILGTDLRLRRRLKENTLYVRAGLRRAGFVLADHPGPIAGIQLDEPARIGRLKRALLAAGILPPFISYSGDATNGWLRFALSSEHSHRQLDNLIRALKPFAPRSVPADR
jgi:7-keto-8-aminopelargonate synthetase-like enzyme